MAYHNEKYYLPPISSRSNIGNSKSNRFGYQNYTPNNSSLMPYGLYPKPYSAGFWPYYWGYGNTSLYPYNLYGDFYYPCLKCKNCLAHPNAYCFHHGHKI